MDQLGWQQDGRTGNEPLLVRDVVRDIVADLAPDEIVLVDTLRRFDDATVLRRLTSARGSRDLLGFGLTEATALITPFVWLAIDQVVRATIDAGAEQVGTGVRGWLRGRLRGRLRRAAPPRPMPSLTPQQLRAVRSRVYDLAVAADHPPEAAAVLADRVVARLALRTDSSTSPGSDGHPDQE